MRVDKVFQLFVSFCGLKKFVFEAGKSLTEKV